MTTSPERRYPIINAMEEVANALRDDMAKALEEGALAIAKRLAAHADELSASDIRDLAESLRIVHDTVLRHRLGT
jgi:hypothetical protein